MKDVAYNEEEYIKGFNLGYKVSKDLPELAELISQIKSEGAKFDGLRDGWGQYVYDLELDKEFDKERGKEQNEEKDKQSYLPWLNEHRLEDLINDVDLNKNKDIEPDI